MNVRYAPAAPSETTVGASVTMNDELRTGSEQQPARVRPPLLPDVRSWNRACRRALRAFGDGAT